MKRISFCAAAATVYFSFATTVVATQYSLLAGQNIPVGVVDVSHVDSLVTVTFEITDESWCISETHLHIAGEVDEIPQTKKGNPIPGRFEFKDEHRCVDEVTYVKAVSGDTVVIAAHAVVYDETTLSETRIVSDLDTDVIEVNGVETPNQKAVYAMEPFDYPNCGSYRQDQPGSLWDNAINYNFNIYGASWIWDEPHPRNPVSGDVVTFQSSLTVPSGLIVGGFLVITADNGYEAMINGEIVGRAQLGPGFGFPVTLRETVEGVTPQTGEWGVASQGWQSVEGWPILDQVVHGQNTLKIVAANEYMNSDDSYFPQYNPPGGDVTQDNVPGQQGIDPCFNPGGLIFKLFVKYLTGSETAWADGGFDFRGDNWATYIEYSLD